MRSSDQLMGCSEADQPSDCKTLDIINAVTWDVKTIELPANFAGIRSDKQTPHKKGIT